MDAILSLWIATLGLTRVNFLGGAADFMLSPFLLLSPLVVGTGVMSTLGRGGNFTIPRGLDRFVVLVSALLAVILVSAFLSHDLATSARRTLLLCVQVVAVVLAGLTLANRPDPRRVLLAGAVAGLGISIFLNVLQAGHWFLGEWLPVPLAGVISTEPGNYSGIVPRLTGGSHDPNHGGLLILGGCFLVYLLAPAGRWRTMLIWAGGLSCVLTLSRSVVLAGAMMIAVIRFRERGMTITRRAATRTAGAIAVACLLLIFVPSIWGAIETIREVMGGRFTLGEGSSREHAAVMVRGWETATRDAKRLLFGVGYGNAFTVLGDIFPGNKYGNFHSLFVTLFAESGVFAAALGIALFGIPLVRGGPFQPLLMALLTFNLFQQSQTEPAAWFWLLLAWTGPGRGLHPPGADANTGNAGESPPSAHPVTASNSRSGMPPASSPATPG